MSVEDRSTEELLDDLTVGLRPRGLDEVELYTKRGRSRRLEIGPHGETTLFGEEVGWAVRAGNQRAGFFAAGTGDPPLAGPWPGPVPPPVRLPGPAPVPRWRPPGALDIPLMVASESRALLVGLAQELRRELPSARILRAYVEDGASEIGLASTRGPQASYRSRGAALFVEVIDGEHPSVPAARIFLAAEAARGFNPVPLARRLADRLLLCREGTAPERDRGDFLLAPPVGIRLLAGLLPLVVGAGARRRIDRYLERDRVAARAVTLIDDGRFPGGALEAPVDGEGVATGETILIEEGMFRRPLLAWWQAERSGEAGAGCSRRSSWRDLPLPGPTHLYLRPDREVSVGSLLTSISRGYYLLDVLGPGRFDLKADRFSLPVCGFAVEGGRARAPVAGVRLRGRVGAFLRGVQAAARDLSFLPLDGMIGCPTVLVGGLELGSG